MAKSRRGTHELILSGIPAILGMLAAIATAIASSKNILDRLKELFLNLNPVTTGVIVVYATVIVGILTVALLLLVRSAERRATRLSEPTHEEVSSGGLAEAEQEPSLSPTEFAARERERNFSRARIAFTRTRRRMVDETERIQRNSLLNLVIGILFSGIALGILGYPLFSTNELSATGWIGLVERFAPRFSVGVLVQLIGFFFLRLYVAGEREVHYLRNELTNWEARLIAYAAALATKDGVAMRENIRELARLERNFKLKKGERTLYETDETYNDVRQLIMDTINGVRQKGKKSHSKSENN